MSKINLDELTFVGSSAEPSAEVEVKKVVEEPDTVTEDLAEEAVEEPEEELSEEPKEVAEEPEESAAEASEEIAEDSAPKGNVTHPDIRPSDNRIVFVKNLKIYPKPSTKCVARSFTGNVEILGQVDKFQIVMYVRPGFGAVKGYVIDNI